MSENAPYFSIIIPVYNRATTLRRCLASVTDQRFTDWEIVAVDDGSIDGSRPLLDSFACSNIRVLAHAENRGVCPARNTGIDAARGEWLVFLDSDDEFAGPDSLARMAELARSAPAGIAALWFRCIHDDGTLSPPALPAERDLDYRGYLRFLEATHGVSRDMIRCVRASAFTRIRYPGNRMLEDKFHLDFARLFRSRLHEDALRLYHEDAPDRLVVRLGRLDPLRDRAFITDRARGLAALLVQHGPALARFAPLVFRAQAKRTIRQLARAALAEARRPFALAAAMIVAGCGTVNTHHMPYAPPVPDAAFVVPAAPYRIRIGDTLSIRLPLSPELDEEVSVRPDGGISATLDPDEHAAGRTVPELEAVLDHAYRHQLIEPQIAVVVKSSSPIRVFVAGAVSQPGEIKTDQNELSLTQAIASAGGVKLAADENRVFILRHGADGKPMFLATRYKDVITGTNPMADVQLASGDVVMVPKSSIAMGYSYWNQYVQQFVPVSWGFSYVLQSAARGGTTVTQSTAQ